MFNDAELWERVGNGSIIDFSTYAADMDLLDTDDVVHRELYLAKDALAEIESWPEAPRSAMFAELLQFMTGALVTWGDPKTGNHMKPLDPVGRWCEFKVRQSPQTRLFGAFIRQDAFLGLKASFRASIETDNQDILATKWLELWAEDAHRKPIDDPDDVLTNYVVLK